MAAKIADAPGVTLDYLVDISEMLVRVILPGKRGRVPAN
ncbi:MAG: hypothetical protein AB7V25_04490 [Mangrovibacterium sp.]